MQCAVHLHNFDLARLSLALHQVERSVLVLVPDLLRDERVLIASGVRVERVALPHIDVRPLALLAGEIHLDCPARLDVGYAAARTFAHAAHTLLAERLAVVHLVVFELGVGEYERESLQRSELRSQQHLAVADLTEPAGYRGEPEVELQIGRDVVASGRAGELHAAVMCGRRLGVLIYLDLLLGRQAAAGRAVHIRDRAARSGVAVDERLVSLVLDQLSDCIQHRGREYLVDTSVRHRWVLEELRSLLNSALHTAWYAEDEADHALGFGEQELRVHIVGGTVHAQNRSYAAGIRSGASRRLLDHLTCKHYYSFLGLFDVNLIEFFDFMISLFSCNHVYHIQIAVNVHCHNHISCLHSSSLTMLRSRASSQKRQTSHS